MEIIHVVLGKANPERMNGVNKVVNELACRQVISGSKVAVWGITSDLEHNYPARNYETRLFLKKRFPFSLPEGFEAAVNGLGRGSRIFHLHGGFVPQMYRVAALLSRKHIPFVFTPHGSYNTIAMQRSRVAKKIYRRLFEASMLRKAGAIHILGKTEKAGLDSWLPGLRVARIPYGFEPATNVTPAAAQEQKFIIGYCGRIDIYTKGLDVLVDGFAQFHSQYPGSELRIIGDGKEMPALEKIVAESTAAAAIKLYGAKYGAEKEALMSRFHVFAHPSRNEGLPAAVLEAAAAGIPCLVTEATNTGDAVARYEAGAVIDSAEAGSINTALQQLYHNRQDDHAYNARRDAARYMVRDMFNWDRLLVSFLLMYQNVLK